MAAKTWYIDSSGSGMFETAPSTTEAYCSPVTGWIVSTGAGVDYASFATGTEVAASNFGATTQPDGSLAASDWLSYGETLTGTFDAGNWVASLVVRAQTNGGAQDGAAVYRLFKGSTVGTAVELTSDIFTGSTVTDLATSASQTSAGTVALGAVTLNGEFLYLQIGWKRTGAGGMTSADVNIRYGTSGSRLVSPNFTASGGASAIAGVAAEVFGQAAALTGTGALAGAAPEVFGQAAALNGTGALAGAAAEVFGQNAVLTTLPSPIAGVAAETFGQAAALTGTGALAGVAAEVFSQAAVIRADGALAGVAAEVFGQAPSLKGTGALAGVAAEVFGQNAALGTAGSGAMAAVGTITFTQAAALTGTGALAAVGTLTFSQSASMVQPAAPVTTTETLTGGRSKPGKKRRWVIGNQTFYGTADEAAELADAGDLPEPKLAPKAKKAKPVVEIMEIERPPIRLPELPRFNSLDYGLLNELNASLERDKAINEQIKILTKQMMEDDDEDVWLLIQ